MDSGVRKGSDVPARVRLLRELLPYQERPEAWRLRSRALRDGGAVITMSDWVVRYRPPQDELLDQLDELDAQLTERALRIRMLEADGLVSRHGQIVELYEQMLDLIDAQEAYWTEQARHQGRLVRRTAWAGGTLTGVLAAAALLAAVL